MSTSEIAPPIERLPERLPDLLVPIAEGISLSTSCALVELSTQVRKVYEDPLAEVMLTEAYRFHKVRSVASSVNDAINLGVEIELLWPNSMPIRRHKGESKKAFNQRKVSHREEFYHTRTPRIARTALSITEGGTTINVRIDGNTIRSGLDMLEDPWFEMIIGEFKEHKPGYLNS